MSGISAIVRRDIQIALRSGGTWAHGLLFFAVFIVISGIALGGDPDVLRPLAPALIWLAVIMSLLLSFERFFSEDREDGSLEHIKLSGISMAEYVIAKCAAHWLLIMLPLLIAVPLVALILNLSILSYAGLFFSILIASPALVSYGAFSAACLVGYRGNGVFLVLLTAPVIIPILIFGVTAVESYASAGLGAIEFQALTGLSLIACAIALPAATAALKSTMD